MSFTENQYYRLSELNIKIAHTDERDIIEHVSFTAPFKITKPFYDEHNKMKIMMLSVSAGIMAGDHQEINIEIGENARAEITSQSYEKIHKMQSGMAKRKTKLTVSSGGLLIYNPLPSIPFSDSAFQTDTEIYLKDKTSKLIYSEIISCGRVGMEERFKYNFYKALTKVYSEDELIYWDNANYVPSQTEMEGFCMFEGYTHLSNMILVNVNKDEELIGKIRDIISDRNIDGGCTETASGDACIRMLANGSERLMEVHKDIIAVVEL